MWATAAADLDPQFGTGGPKLVAWQNLVASQLPSATGANAPIVDLAQPGLSTQSRSVVVTVFWQMPGETVAASGADHRADRKEHMNAPGCH